MTPAVTVVGSGASGVHFALTVLRKGGRVRMLDVGRTGRAAVLPSATLNGLKSELPDPTGYFLGTNYESVLLPGVTDEYYGIPPSKDYVFEAPAGFDHASRGFAPLFSFAGGGLAEAWTGGCYPLKPEEVVDFPFAPNALAPHYSEVARRIGVSGAADDLARFMPMHDHLQPPLRLDRHSEALVARYGRVRDRMNARGVYLGRSRVATISEPLGTRLPCNYSGRCLWGCPRGSLYTRVEHLQVATESLSFPFLIHTPHSFETIDWLSSATIGGVLNVNTRGPFEIGIGADATFYDVPANLRSSPQTTMYGASPKSFHVFIRVRPRAPSMGHMWNMIMSDSAMR